MENRSAAMNAGFQITCAKPVYFNAPTTKARKGMYAAIGYKVTIDAQKQTPSAPADDK